MRRYIICCLLVALCLKAGAQEEFNGPFAGWANVKTAFGAVGDGRADDTAALQKALDSLVGPGTTTAIYLPAGTYRITHTLVLPRKAAREAIGLNIQGEDPWKVTLRWEGEPGGVMFDYGAWYSKLGRITFEGAGKAKTCLRHGPQFVTANELADLYFRNCEIGIEAGRGAGIAETSVLRCRFDQCSVAGARMQDFNTLDWWFWHCRFDDCRVGVTNAPGAGNFYVYESSFLRSTEADISIGNTGYFSFRGNTSVGSKAFFVAGGIGAAALLTFQRNLIVEPTDSRAIQVGNLGPVLLLDNTILSQRGAKGPVAVGANAQVTSLGNSFRVAAPLAFKAGSLLLGDNVRQATDLEYRVDRTVRPRSPICPPRVVRPVIEVASGADGEAIQRAITQAAAMRGKRAIVHLPGGVYPIRRTLQIPPGADLQIVGEGTPYVTRLEWRGEGVGPMMHIAGPSHAALRDFVLDGGGKADGLVIDGCDVAGGQVRLEQTLVDGAKAHGYRLAANHAQVLLRDAGHSGCHVGVAVPGGHATILSGASSSNDLSYEITQGGKLLACDIWYETNDRPAFMRLTDRGGFTLNGSNIALPRKPGTPGVLVDGFHGDAAFLGVLFTQVGPDTAEPEVVVQRAAPDTRLLILGCNGSGEFFADRTAGGHAARLNSTQYTPGGGAQPIADAGRMDAATLRQMLAPLRAWPGDDLVGKDAPVAVLLHRLFIRNPRTGIQVSAAKSR